MYVTLYTIIGKGLMRVCRVNRGIIRYSGVQRILLRTQNCGALLDRQLALRGFGIIPSIPKMVQREAAQGAYLSFTLV
jgi:hypothetical protein